jgi:hypothetical protein
MEWSLPSVSIENLTRGAVMKELSIWLSWYLMLLGVPILVLALFVEDWFKTRLVESKAFRRV